MPDQTCVTHLGRWLAGTDNGSVYYCPSSNVVTLSLHYMTLRFDAPSFRDLLGMMGFAQAEIQRISEGTDPHSLQDGSHPGSGGALH